MANIKLFQNKKDRSIVIVPFAFDHIGNRATGDSIYMSEDDFKNNGFIHIQEVIDNYYTRTDFAKSELYQIMPKNQREHFLKKHYELSIGIRNDDPEAIVYSMDKGGEEVARIPYPFNPETFCEEVIKLFDEYSHE